MRRFNVLIGQFVVMFAIMFAGSRSFAAISGSVENAGEFEIVENLDHMDISSPVSLWNLTYSKGNSGIEIQKNEISEGTEYVVKSEFFEVRYVNNENGFGVRSIKHRNQTVPYSINSVVLNSHEMEYQEKISCQKLDEEYALSLIASYLPDLINEDYRHLLM